MTNAAAKIVQAVVTVAFGVIPATLMLLLASAMMLVGLFAVGESVWGGILFILPSMVLTVLGAFGVAGLWVAAFGPKHMTTRNVVYLVLGVAASSTWMLLEPEFSRRFLFFFLAPVIVALGHLSWWAFAWLLPSMHRTS